MNDPGRAFRSVLIANRGEIAVRIAMACREAGLRAIAVYSEADRGALHVAHADEAYPIGPAPATESYLNGPAILEATRHSGAEAIHPGYGFLSENAAFARAVQDAGLVWIGPPPAAIATLGDKVEAKRIMAAAGVPLVPGYDGMGDDARLTAEATAIGYPVLVKAAAGGGGRGMRVVEHPDDFAEALAAARREASAAFGDDRVFLERYLQEPRHIEIQVFGDRHGRVIHLGERECSIQRRHQKVIEEAPSPIVDADLRARMGAAAVAAAQAVDYVGAGTVEFLLDRERNFYFLEMNTRLQVEHPVTEFVTGLDLVALQLRVAAGEALSLQQEQVTLRGHAIECRIYAEDAATNFLPQSGMIRLFAPPDGPGVRNDVGVTTGDEVSVYYDPQLAKLIVHAPDRPAAIARLSRALEEYAILGLTTNLSFLHWIVNHPAFQAGETTTAFIATHWSPPAASPLPREVLLGTAALDLLDREARSSRDDRAASPWQTLGAWRSGGAGAPLRLRYADQAVTLTTARADDGNWRIGLSDEEALVRVAARADSEIVVRERARTFTVRGVIEPDGLWISWRGQSYHLIKPAPLTVESAGAATGAEQATGTLTAPMPGKLIRVLVAEGAHVAANQPIATLEAMKMEHTIAAPHAGTVQRLHVAAGAFVTGGAVLAEIVADL